MKKYLFTLCLAAISTIGFAQNENRAEITFERDVIDYGTIEKGSDGNREFVFTNTGNEPLIITNAKGSCGCTVPTWPEVPIAPGEKGTIKVHYDTQRVGPFNKSVTIYSNAKTDTKVVNIKGVVKDTSEAEGNSKS